MTRPGGSVPGLSQPAPEDGLLRRLALLQPLHRRQPLSIVILVRFDMNDDVSDFLKGFA